MRMSMRRFTRLTNGFSKKLENHEAAIAFHYMHYNFCRIHQSLRVTPAMEAGIADHVWSLDEVIALLPASTRSRSRIILCPSVVRFSQSTSVFIASTPALNCGCCI